MQKRQAIVGAFLGGGWSLPVLVGLSLVSRSDFLLFHSLAELFGVVVTYSVFVLAWNSRRRLDNNYLLFLGIAFLFVGGLHLVHALGYRKMGVFPGHDPYLGTQVWIAARFALAIAFLVAPVFLARRLPIPWVMAAWITATAIVLSSLLWWRNFPLCFVEGQGLTTFKKVSEYIISAIILASTVPLYRKRSHFAPEVFRLIFAAVLVCFAAELPFAVYNNVFDLFNVLGHFLSILCFYLVYRALIVTGLRNPHELLFRTLKQREEALRVSQERFRTLAQASFEGVCISEEGQIRDCNDQFAAMLGYDRGGLVGKSIPELLAPEWREMVSKSIREGRELVVESDMLHKDGHRLTMEAHGKNINDQGRLVRITVVRDITARKQTEQDRAALLDAERAARGEMERVNRMKDEFLATVSHELRSPLSAILGWTRLLRKKKTDNPDHALGVIERSAQALTHLIEDMLDMGRIMSGKVRLEIQEVEPKSLVVDVLDGFRPVADTKGISLVEHYESNLGSLRCDPARIRQVLSNLLTNALKFTPTGGSIHVYLRTRGDRLQLIVRDTGQGISSDFLPQLFGKFLQAESSTTRKHGGLGLGLAIVKQIVELHEGSIRAASAGEGKGAAFSVTMPSFRPRSLPDAATRPSSGGVPGEDQEMLELPTGMDVLLIDDDPDAMAVVSRILTESKANVIMARSAEEGLRLFQERRPRLVVSDISMPQEDGYSLIRKIRATDGRDGQTICVALTALTRPEDREKALSLGFDEHLSKLTDPTTVVHTLRKLVLKSALDQFKARRTGGPAEPASANPSREPSHVLLAEDNETISHMLKICLEDEGYRVSVVATVAAGLEVASTQPVDLLVTDLSLKDGTGWDLMARLRESLIVPGIMMSGYTDRAHQDKSKQVGFAEYLTKPVDTDELVRAIGRVTATMPALRHTPQPVHRP